MNKSCNQQCMGAEGGRQLRLIGWLATGGHYWRSWTLMCMLHSSVRVRGVSGNAPLANILKTEWFSCILDSVKAKFMPLVCGGFH